MKTLSQIINSEATTATEKAIQAAFWAGQSDMRGKITEAAGKAMASLSTGRYHHMQKAAAAHILSGCPQINTNSTAFGSYGDTGAGEAAEILAWDFEV